jgi:NTE family protein
MARGFAHAGALRALHDAGIPIGAIVGTEFGALIGTLYAENATINRFEWSLLKLREELFHEKSVFGSGAPADGSRLDTELGRLLGSKKLEEARFPVLLATAMPGESPSMVKAGPAARAARDAVTSAAVQDKPFAVAEARQLAIGPVIVIDPLASPAKQGEGEEIAARMSLAKDRGAAELRDADLVIAPDLSGIGYLDFNRKTDIVFRGKKAVLARIADIKRLTGLVEKPAAEAGAEKR